MHIVKIMYLAGLLGLPAFRNAHGAVMRFVDKQGVVHYKNQATKIPKLCARPAAFHQPVLQAAQLYKLSPALLHAVIHVESSFKPMAVSRAGALGLMQLLAATASEMAVEDPLDPTQNIFGGARYLRFLLNRYQGNIKLALAAYNAGPKIVDRLGRVPRITETQKYVARVWALYRCYATFFN